MPSDSILMVAIYLCCNALRIYSIYILMTVFFQRERGFYWVEIALYAGFYLVNSIAHLLWGVPIINLLDNILFIFAITFLYQSGYGKKVISTAIIFSVGVIVEIVVTSIFDFQPQGIESSISIVISCLLCFIIAYVIKSHMGTRNDATVSIFQTMAISAVALSSIFIAVVLTQSEIKNNHYYVTIAIVLLVAMNFLVVYLYDVVRDRAERIRTEELLKLQNNAYIKQYNAIFESQRGLRSYRHNMKGHMLALQTLLKCGEYEEAESYIQNCYDVLCSSENKVNSGNIVIDSIINSKYQEASNCGVSILCDIKVPECLNIAPFDLSAILYNLLENAMSAVLELEHDRVIDLLIELDRGVLYISIKNRYTGEIVYQGDNIVTRSKDLLNHGYGLESIRTAINKYDGNMRIKHDEGLFEVLIMLYNKKYVEESCK